MNPNDRAAHGCVDAIVELVDSGSIPSKAQVDSLKKKFSSGSTMLRNSELIAAVDQFYPERAGQLRELLRIRSTRTISGVAPVAVMTISDCPHGTCLYCPKGESAAQSYTGEEPAALRARQYGFDPYQQVQARLSHYKAIGYSPDKCELIVMGGTFLSMQEDYVEWFMKGAYEGFNGKRSSSSAQAILDNELAEHRVIGTTFETRPDYCFEKHVDMMLSYGSTRIELGVQCLSDSVYRRVNRGHSIADVIKATRIAKNSGFKLCYHMMPGLLCSPAEDLSYFRELFSNPDFQPDMLKIYPTLVLEGTGLYNLWKKGDYQPYDTAIAAELVKEVKKLIPPYVRIMRVQRDIPLKQIAAGVVNSNLREIALKKLAAEGLSCQCIRCRELGVRKALGKQPKEDFKLKELSYPASGSAEYFLSYESSDGTLAGFLRARDIRETHRPELRDSLVVRELHVYGSQLSVGEEKKTSSAQHKGYGKNLLARAEELAKELDKKKIAVISGVGAREYYRKLGYSLEGSYMVKDINDLAILKMDELEKQNSSGKRKSFSEEQVKKKYGF